MKRLKRKADGCHFIEGEPRWRARKPAPFCGAPKKPGSSYCIEHHTLTHMDAPPLKLSLPKVAR